MTTTYVNKPWGSEEIWAHTPRYVGKILYINPNSKLSLQYHNEKEETIRVLKGRLYLHREVNKELIVTQLVEGDTFHIPTKTVHRFEAREEAVELVEVSTSQLDDVVRLQDDYERARNRSDASDFPSI